MNYILIFGVIILLAAIVAGFRFAWELLQQHGRMLLRMEALERRIEEKADAGLQDHGLRDDGTGTKRAEEHNAEVDQSLVASAATGMEDARAERFSSRSLVNSKIKRDGLKVGTLAPEFRLPRLEGGELALSELRGRFVLLVFSSPKCGPCNTLASKLEKFYRKFQRNEKAPSPLTPIESDGRGEPGTFEIVMVSQGEAEENRAKVKEHGITFPVVLQKQWEVCRDYAYFATPVAYLIDEAGTIGADVAVGVDGVVDLITRIEWMFRRKANTANTGLLKRMAGWPVTAAVALLRWLMMGLGAANSRLHLFHLRHFKFVPRADDIFIVTYPRSGTTWMQMILYQLTTDGNMDIPHVAEHCPWFERSMRSAQGFENRPSPRLFKTHLPFRQVPKGQGRYIYVARDGRDVAVSYYNLYRNYNQYEGTFDEFFGKFIRGKVHFGSWFDHVEGWRKHRNDLNVLFVTYEELTHDLEGSIRRIMAFSQLQVAEEKLPQIIERCSFAFMKQHESKFDPALEMLWENGTQLNSFLRVGRTGEGARELTKAQRTRFDQVLGGYKQLGDLERQGAPVRRLVQRPESNAIAS